MSASDIDAHTRLVGVMGHPVTHSRSPQMHNAAFRAQGLNFAYLALPVLPAGLTAAVHGLRALGFAGANVTLPHKQAVLALMDTLSAHARAVGAVNTIVCKKEKGTVRMHGDNTDVAGFLEPLRPFGERLQGASMLVFGAGGAARAVVYALLTAFTPSRLTLAARNPAAADELAEAFAQLDTRSALDVVPLSEARSAVQASTLLVNATPLGMTPNADTTPWPDASGFSTGQLVYDLVYTPEKTRLLHDAASRRADTLGGLDMLIAQAAASYIQWTEKPMPLEVVRAVLRKG